MMFREDLLKFLVNVGVTETPATLTGRRSAESAWFQEEVPLLPCRKAGTQGKYIGNSSGWLQHSRHSRVHHEATLQEHSQQFVAAALSPLCPMSNSRHSRHCHTIETHTIKLPKKKKKKENMTVVLFLLPVPTK